MSTSRFISRSEAATRQFAAGFARTLQGNEKICLIGPLGSGKTTFVRGFVEAFHLPAHAVQSPTFTLVREYSNNVTIYHVDLYRLDKEEEIFEAGIYDIISGEGLVLIEWADRLKKYYPLNPLEIKFEYISETEREIYAG